MIGAGSVEFAATRIFARQAARPTEFDWRRIEVVRDARALLHVARTMPPFAPWLAGVTADGGVHAVEARFRACWRRIVDEIASLMPPSFTPAIRWCAIVDDLPALAHLARTRRAARWIEQDERLGPIAQRAHAGRPADAVAGTPYAALAPALSEPASLPAAWATEWRGRLPRLAEDDRAHVETLVRMLARHRSVFASSRVDGWPARIALARALDALLHRCAGSPACAFVHLALRALDGERLRAEVVRRVALPAVALAA